MLRKIHEELQHTKISWQHSSDDRITSFLCVEGRHPAERIVTHHDDAEALRIDILSLLVELYSFIRSISTTYQDLIYKSYRALPCCKSFLTVARQDRCKEWREC